MEQIYQFCLDNLNYWTITLFMTIESSFIPFPSEIVVPPAGYLAADGKLNIYLIIFFSTLGSLLGAVINYGLSFYLGRPIIYKFANSKVGKILLLSEDGIKKAETYFNNNGAVSTFIGRLIPGIRQLISIPAGLSKMRLPKFVLYTALGAGIWNTVLCIIGYALHEVASNLDAIPELAKSYGSKISLGIVAAVAIIGVAYYLINKKKNKEENV